jgi:hypothetical protein
MGGKPRIPRGQVFEPDRFEARDQLFLQDGM